MKNKAKQEQQQQQKKKKKKMIMSVNFSARGKPRVRETGEGGQNTAEVSIVNSISSSSFVGSARLCS